MPISKKYSVKQKMSDNLIEQLLFNRGIKTEEEKSRFLNPDFENHLHDPFLLSDMEKATNRVLKALENNERIGIWSDYDADGIPGGALLYDFFRQIGFNNFINYIPDRHVEGYGLNNDGLEELAKDGISLLITVDCGVRNNNEIALANELGMEIIVTDHHEPASAPPNEATAGKLADDLPNAYAIINPKRVDSKYPEKILCGTGVIWKLIEAILQKKEGVLKKGQEKWLLDLVGLATLSDMVPLTGENRALAHFGLRVLRKSKRLGLIRLFSSLKINKNDITEDDIAFMITPRINAASRMGHPLDAFNLLVSQDEVETEGYIKHLENINGERKIMVANVVKEAKKRIRERFKNSGEKPIIVLGDPSWRPAILGLAANSIVEEYDRPVFLWGRENGDSIKGSCRSEGMTDLVALMEKAKDHFVEFGGHKLSGGFAVDYEKIHTLEEVLTEASLLGQTNTRATNEDLEISIDAELKLGDISENSVAEILKLSPFGVGNEKPVFIFRDVIPEKINRFGKNQEHLSVNLRDGGDMIRAISFFASPDRFGDNLKEGIKTNLVANIEKSFFNKSSEIRLRIVDFF